MKRNRSLKICHKHKISHEENNTFTAQKRIHVKKGEKREKGDLIWFTDTVSSRFTAGINSSHVAAAAGGVAARACVCRRPLIKYSSTRGRPPHVLECAIVFTGSSL